MDYIDRTREAARHTMNFNRQRILNQDNPNRSIGSIDSIVIHSMGFHRSGEAHRYDRVSAHYAVLLNGLIIRLRSEELYVNASNSLNAHSIAIEFEGNFPEAPRNLFTKQDCERHRPRYDYPTFEQIQSGKQLIGHLIRQFTNINGIYAHLQSHPHKPCPGPHIWYNIGKWSIECLGLINPQSPNLRLIPASYYDPQYSIFSSPAYCNLSGEILTRTIRRYYELQVCGEPIVNHRNNLICK